MQKGARAIAAVLVLMRYACSTAGSRQAGEGPGGTPSGPFSFEKVYSAVGSSALE
jgi:hypothetical protein